MKKELLTATALTASTMGFGAGLAHAQFTTPIDWNGVYVSLGVGEALLHDRVTTDIHGSASFTNSPTIGTMGVGANWAHGSAVLGFDVDVSFLNSHHTGVTSGGASVETSLERLMTARAKLGFAHQNLLFYGTAGLAVGNPSLATSFTDPGKGGGTDLGSRSDTLFGWSAGGGAEVAATNRVSFKVEGIYYRLPSLTVTTTGTALNHYTASFVAQGWMVRAGINVKLN